MTALRELFGGAITLEVPSNFIDASDLRQVPDTQEVLLDPESDMSVILEILQRVDVKDDVDAVKFHFDSLAHDNSATDQKILNIIPPIEPPTLSPPETPLHVILHGEQEVRKFNCPTPDRVCLLVALYRIEAKEVDLVLTANIPFSTDSGTSQLDEKDLLRAKQRFDVITSSLKIVDFSLFA